MVYNEAFKDATIASNPSPFRYLMYREREFASSYIERRVYELAERSVPSELAGLVPVTSHVYGLSITDLFRLDYAAFCKLEHQVEEYIKRHTPTPRKEIDPYKDLLRNQQRKT